MFRFVPLILVFLVLSGCSGAEEQPVPPPPAPPTSAAAPSELPEDDPPGTRTCAALAEAITDSSLMTPGIADGIRAAAVTADAPVADAAERLAAAYASAVAAAGEDNEPDAVAAVGAAASDMSTVCSDSGLQTVG
ncbi:hypothetical protein M1L60_19395 [Actinoplanes sp. TRM 88003]|uniref:Antifreeze protein n=1 Tax=Paractinoplanes aksuensis TaxID=2939490 RepID=A0ABT1DPI8_9ACTN|nr:hypothetical protein [Actinoplanes aksuensis]MCO8272764.1 hypothetical protein [Actinoplanes aksuensis]